MVTSYGLFRLAAYALVILALAMSAVKTVPKAIAQADSIKDGIFQPGSKPYGKTYGEWSAALWQWILSLPSDKSPNNDNTGKNCHQGQTGPVWYLWSTFGGAAERSCTIPSDKAIFFPLLSAECSFAEYPQYKTESDLRKCAKDQADKITSMEATIDGRKITDLQKFRIQSPPFEVTLPKNNVLGSPAGSTKSVSDGFWIMFSPLSPGKHELHFSASAVDFTSSAPINIAIAATYHLNISK